MRASEDYSYLKSETGSPYEKGLLDEIKYIPITKNRASYLTLGGSYRPRFEHFTNRNWTAGNQSYFAQRLSVHSSLHFGKRVRFFGELYSGYKGGAEAIPQSDEIDLHQGYVEVGIPLGEATKATVIFGRNEVALGASRLVGIRDGPNMRRSFDLGKVSFSHKQAALQAFYGKEVSIRSGAFDNRFSLFDQNAGNVALWGLYSRISSVKRDDHTELYYLGFESDVSRFNDVVGAETRHTVGVRRVGVLQERWQYNTELIYQFGELGDNTISAFNIETDWNYKLLRTAWNPSIGLKFDWSSGDREKGDGKIQTFNPMFVNPGIYSLAAVNTPANLFSIHPSITVYPLPALSLKLEYAFFYRTSVEDGLYAPTRFQTRAVENIDEKHIGDTIGLLLNYGINRNLTFSLVSSYFVAGSFLADTGDAESIFYLASTLHFKF
ncbi:MAG: alginate export family protein [Bacteroidota bacterium]